MDKIKPNEIKLVKIEIGECLLEAIVKIIDKAESSCDAGIDINNAFGIDFTKIIDNKYLEIKK